MMHPLKEAESNINCGAAEGQQVIFSYREGSKFEHPNSGKETEYFIKEIQVVRDGSNIVLFLSGNIEQLQKIIKFKRREMPDTIGDTEVIEGKGKIKITSKPSDTLQAIYSVLSVISPDAYDQTRQQLEQLNRGAAKE